MHDFIYLSIYLLSYSFAAKSVKRLKPVRGQLTTKRLSQAFSELNYINEILNTEVTKRKAEYLYKNYYVITYDVASNKESDNHNLKT